MKAHKLGRQRCNCLRDGQRRWMLAVVFALMLLPKPLDAQDGGAIRRTDTGVELDFQDADLRLVVSALAELAGLSLMYGDLPPRQITLRTSGPVPTGQIRAYLEGVLEANGLELIEEDGLLRVSGAELAVPQPVDGVEAQVEPSDAPRLYVYRLKNAESTVIAQTLGAVFGSAFSPTGGGLSRTGLSDELRQQREAYAPGALNVGDAQSPGGGAAPAGLTAQLEGEIRIVPDPPTNSLLLHASPSDYETLRAAIEAIDTRPLQVLIEVLIAEVRRDRTRGLSLSGTVEKVLDGGDRLEGELEGLTAGDLALRVLTLGQVSIDAVLRVLSASSDVTILSRPVLLAQNNEEARILVGSQRPFILLSRALPTDDAVRDQVVQYRDVGTQLNIRPTINPDGYVKLSILQEVSSATSEVQFGAPVISTREANTKLLVKDGHTVVLGGLVDNQRERSRSGVPVLKDIPVLGGLFGSQQERQVETELFLFLTPHVLRTDEEMDSATDQVRDAAPNLNKRLPTSLPLLGGAVRDSVSVDGGAEAASSKVEPVD